MAVTTERLRCVLDPRLFCAELPNAQQQSPARGNFLSLEQEMGGRLRYRFSLRRRKKGTSDWWRSVSRAWKILDGGLR